MDDYEEKLGRRILPLFTQNINSRDFILLVHKHNPEVLSLNEMARLTKEMDFKPDVDVNLNILLTMRCYPGWFQCILDVCGDPLFKRSWLKTKFEEIKRQLDESLNGQAPPAQASVAAPAAEGGRVTTRQGAGSMATLETDNIISFYYNGDVKTTAGEIKGDTVVDQLKEVAYDAGVKEQPWMKKGAKQLSAKDLDNQMDILMRGKYLKNNCIDMNDYKTTLGVGHFGRVWKASIRKPHTDLRNVDAQNDVWTPVAVKKLRVTSPAEERAFVREVLLACDVNHENCVRVLHLGIDMKGPTGFSHRMMIMEYMNGGSLIRYAAKCGDLKDQATINKMINVCLDVAKGMVYLSGKSIVHRDLAARNILLCEHDGKTTAKVSGFGMARTLESNYRFYIVKPEEEVPFPWMPPECLKLEELTDFGKFTSLGDVWSFGIVMWEAFSKGQNVKTEIRPSNLPKLLLERYKTGWRLPRRENMGSAVYNVMDKCWQLDPQARPPFVELVEILKSLL